MGMAAILEFFAEALIQLLLTLFWWLIGFPIIWLASLPFILLFAIFSSKPYRGAVFDMLASVSQFWAGWGLSVVP
jgi:hypothetical protein